MSAARPQVWILACVAFVGGCAVPLQPARAVAPPSPPAPRAAVLAREMLRRVDGLRAAAGASEGRLGEVLARRLCGLTRFRKPIMGAYAARAYRPLLITRGALTDEGKRAIELLRSVAEHGVDPAPYRLAALEAALASFQATERAVRPAAADEAPDVAALWALLETFEDAPGETADSRADRMERALLAAHLRDGAPAPLDLVDRRIAAGSVARERAAKALVEVEVLTVQGFLRYVLDFTLTYRVHPTKALTSGEIPIAETYYAPELEKALLGAGDALGTAMRGSWPDHPYYEKTLAAYARYRKLAETKAVPPWRVRSRLEAGAKGPEVALLKQRLAAEGYYSGVTTDDFFGPDLVDAVKRYQRHHQLVPDGVVEDKKRPRWAGQVHRSLAIPMAAKAEQLRLALQRWRESPVSGPSLYLRVNIPQYELEVWEKRHLVRKHRIVVGNTLYVVDTAGGRRGSLNRTAMLSARVETVVLNPYWNVPPRIQANELAKDGTKDIEGLRKKGFRVKTRQDGTEQLVQGPGPRNALGQVKLLFPNRHAIYLHDTPQKKLFDRTIRAFSHGCMRLEDPVTLATWLLEREGLMTADQVSNVLKSRRNTKVQLREPIPIHIHYNTVVFEPDGTLPMFLHDIYGYDGWALAGKVPYRRKKTLESRVAARPKSRKKRSRRRAPAPAAPVDEEPPVCRDLSSRP